MSNGLLWGEDRFHSILLNNINIISHFYRFIRTLRNICISQSTGEYIIIWDDDDIYHPERVEVQMKSALQHNALASMLCRETLIMKPEDTIYLGRWRLFENSLLIQRGVRRRNSKNRPTN